MRAIGYLRVSTDDQAREGVSLKAQESKIRAWANLNEYSEVLMFTDAGISGSKSDREGLSAALATIKRGDALVVYSLSRLSRSTRDTLEIADRLNNRGADLVSLSEKIDTTSAAGKMVFRMLAVLAEFERDQVAERTKMALQHKKAKGERVGSVPFGYVLQADGKTLNRNPDEREIVDFAQRLRRDGLSCAHIADKLSAAGYKTRTGREFASMQVWRMTRGT